MTDEIVFSSHRLVWMSLNPRHCAAGRRHHPLFTGSVRLDHHRKHGVLLVHTMYQSETVCESVVCIRLCRRWLPAQDNHYDHDARALLYYQRGSCEVRPLITHF